MSDFLRERMFGVRPVHRTNPQPGQSEWYYLDPRNNHRLADRPEIDVESENSPNPYANEIQNYLYKNDEYNYKQLYGNTPPPSMQPTQTGANVDTNNIGSSDVNDGLNDYQRAMLNVAQAAAKGNYMSGVNGANNGQVFANSDYTVNTESLVGKPSSYFQNNNSTYPQQSQTVQNTNNDNIEAQKRAQALQAQRDAVNQILMNGMDVLYGMNRTINGMTAGGLDYLGQKLGFDSQMNNYLQLKNPQEREMAQTAGNIVQWGGNAVAGGALAKAGLNQANIAYNGYKIGKKYDQLVEDPFQGNGNDVIARMKNHNDEPVVLQRGEAIQGPNGRVITSGNELKRVVGTKRNYGLDKGIYKHEVSREDAQRIPRIIQQKPMETNSYGQNVYLVRSKNGAFRVVTSPKDDENIIATMYYVDR